MGPSLLLIDLAISGHRVAVRPPAEWGLTTTPILFAGFILHFRSIGRATFQCACQIRASCSGRSVSLRYGFAKAHPRRDTTEDTQARVLLQTRELFNQVPPANVVAPVTRTGFHWITATWTLKTGKSLMRFGWRFRLRFPDLAGPAKLDDPQISSYR
jgi:hypothetical protein